MFSTVLSALVLGLVPVSGRGVLEAPVVTELSVAPPAYLLSIGQRLSASGVLVMDADSGQQVFARGAEVRRPMASLTKLMTALLIVENHSLDEVVRIPASATQVPGNKAYLPSGENFVLGEVLSAMLIASANDAAMALSIFHSGSVEAFVGEMNERAATLGLRSTAFANPAGLDDNDQWSTPEDIAWLTSAAFRHPEISRRLSMRGAIIQSLEGTEIAVTHTHDLLHTETSILAGKTGTTGAAGQCLMSVVEEGSRRYLVVLLDSLQRYRDMHVILDALHGAAVARQTETLVPPDTASGG